MVYGGDEVGEGRGEREVAEMSDSETRNAEDEQQQQQQQQQKDC